jgi:NADH-quinone oxidoreductase subunit C
MTSIETLQQRFGGVVSEFRDSRRVTVHAASLGDALSFLKADASFDFLADITAIDYVNYPNAKDRFGVVYCLLNTATGERLVVKTLLNEPDLTLPSVFSLWKGADWLEREVYDMYGIVFEGHPNLRRLLMPEEFTTYPLRKDYPLRGRGERHNFPVITRAES